MSNLTSKAQPVFGPDGKVNLEEAASSMVTDAERRPAQILSLAERCREAKLVFAESTKGLGEYYEQFKPAAEKMITDARMCRMTMTAELANIKREAKEVQEFVGSAQYVVTIERMKELVDLAERFVKLSKEQSLPILLDAALKLQVKP